MHRKLQTNLFRRYKSLYSLRTDDRTRLGQEGIAVGDGWYDLLTELSDILSEEFTIQLTEVSSRDGMMQISKTDRIKMGYREEDSARIEEAIRLYCKRSRRICEVCGLPSQKHLVKGHAICEKCENEDNICQ